MSATATSFYVTGGTLRSDTPSYVERRADTDLYEGLKGGEFCYVLTSRQMGKSSLMNRTAARLREEGIVVVTLDLTRVGQNLTAEQWYGGLLIELMGHPLGLEEELEAFWLENERLGPLQRWMAALREVILPRFRGQLVLFIDEIDTVRSLPFATDEFFAAIRECYNRRTEDPEFERLTFCLLGVATPTDLIRDTRMTPFNIGRRIELNDFTEDEAAPLAAGLRPGLSALGSPLSGKDGGSRGAKRQAAFPTESREPRAESMLRRILHWTGGHPYLTQRLCHAVAESGNVASGVRMTAVGGNVASGVQVVDRLCAELFLSAGAQERDDNLIFVRERLLRPGSDELAGADPAALLDLYGKVRRGERVPADNTNQLVSVIRLSGITRVQEASRPTPYTLHPTPSLTVRNRIYARVFDREWVAQHMPDAELRRQKTAFRRGLLRAASVGGVIVTLMTFLVLAAVGQAHRAEAASVQADREATTAKALATRLQVALRDKQAALEEKERAFRRLRASLAAEQIARGRANTAERRERAQRVSAERARREAVAQRGWADQQRRIAEGRRVEAERERGRAMAARAQAQERLVGMYVATGNRLIDEGDLLGALPWFAEALSLEEGKGAREAVHRMRLATVLQQCPRPVRVLPHNGTVWHAGFSPDGGRVVTASEDGTARVWDATTGQPLTPLMKHNRWVRQAAFSPDGRRIVTASLDATARVWDASTGQPLSPPLKHNGYVWLAAFSPDGRRVLTASSDGTARVWDAITGQPFSPPLKHTGAVEHAAFSPDGRRIATASLDSTTRVWDAITGQPLSPPLKHNEGVLHVRFSPDSSRVVTASYDSTARVWDAASGRPITPPLTHNSIVWQAAFSPDGRRVLTASSDQTARVWDAATGQPLSTPLTHNGYVWQAAFSADGRRIVTASGDQTARVWDAASGQPVTSPLEHAGEVHHAAFNPDGRLVVTASSDQTARVWDAATGQPVTPPLKHNDNVRRASFSPDGRRVVTAGWDNTARVWDAASGQPVTGPLKHNSAVQHAAFSADGRRVVTASRDDTARVWDAASGLPVTLPLKHREGVGHAVFSPDGRRVVTASWDNTARVWDAASGRHVTSPLKHSGWVWQATFSPDGRWIVTASHDRTARVWDAASGLPITPPLKHSAWVRYAAFSPDGRRVVTASRDNTAQVWDVSADPRPAADLRRLAQWLAGYRIDARAGSVPLDPAAARREEQTLRAKYPADFAASPAQVVAWREREAVDAERSREWAAALPHLDALLAAQPAHAGLYARRGRAHAELGHWEQAAVDFAQAGEREPNVPTHGSFQALAQLAGGDTSGYQRRRASMLTRFGRSDNPVEAYAVALTCVVAAEGVTDAAPLVVLAERAAAWTGDPRTRWAVELRGAALYRAGRLEEAVQRLTEAVAAPGGGEATGWLFLAMTHAHLGHGAEARQWLEKAAAWIEEALQRKPEENPLPWDQRLVLQHLRREAEALLPPADAR